MAANVDKDCGKLSNNSSESLRPVIYHVKRFFE